MKKSLGLYETISKSVIALNLRSRKRDGVLKELVSLLKVDPKGKDILLKTLIKREEMGSTGLGKRIAIPHARTLLVKEFHLIIGLSRKGIEFKSFDKKPVQLFFLLIAPPLETSSSYLITLGKIAGLAKVIAKDGRLFGVKDKKEFFNILKEIEEKR